MNKVAVFGLALTGDAVARALVARGIEVVIADDHVTQEHRRLAQELDIALMPVGSDQERRSFLDGVDTVLPAPGVPMSHPLINLALSIGVSVRTEIDVAYEWEQQRKGGSRPILGVTGTDGKTTTTMIAAHLLRSSGRVVAEVGNTDVPFIAALDSNSDVFVVECSSFRLQFIDQFRCDTSVWLNIAPDHLDWHGTFETYFEAKARIWSHVRSSDVAIVPSNNEMIVDKAKQCGAKVVTFGLTNADYCLHKNEIITPFGKVGAIDKLWRSMPHDITNSLAAVALVLEAGLMNVPDVASPLTDFIPAHHRIELVGTFAGSRWFDDSKATSPHAALTAIRSFDRVVLIAGGRNKDLDLSQLASEPARINAVVAIGDDAALIESTFRNICPVVNATTMKQAVEQAAMFASPGVDVLLSPGCTSYDWYRNYNERGDDFQNCVRAHFGKVESQHG